MSSYTTLHVTRSKALETVAARLELELARARDGRMSDEDLTAALDEYLQPQLIRVQIVSDGDTPNDDDRVPALDAI